MKHNIITAFVVGTVTGAVSGYVIDKIVVKVSPFRYALSIPSGTVIGLFAGGIGGVSSAIIRDDNGLVGGAIVGIVAGVLGGISEDAALLRNIIAKVARR